MRSLTIIGAFLFALWPLTAGADVAAMPGVVDAVTVGTPLSRNLPLASLTCGAAVLGLGACWLASMLVYAVEQGRTIIWAFAFLMIVVAGFRLIISQSEESLTTARRTVLSVIIGLFLLHISEPFVDALYGGVTVAPGSVLDSTTNLELGAKTLSKEMMGIMRWIETVVAIIAVALLVAQAIAVLGSFGTEDTIRKSYRAVLATITGLLLLVFDRMIAAIFGFRTLGDIPVAPDAQIFIVEIFGLIRFLLFFVAIIMVGVIIYAGFMMVLHFGNEEFITKSKTILINSLLGLVLIVMSFVIVSTLILGIT